MSSISKNYPPKARKKLVKRKVHSTELSDHFDWIRDNNWQEVLISPNVLKKNINKTIITNIDFEILLELHCGSTKNNLQVCTYTC